MSVGPSKGYLIELRSALDRIAALEQRTPELDRKCGTCEGKGVVTNPEWERWAARADAAKAAWQEAHPGESWYSSTEGRAVEDSAPDEAEIGCVECEFRGYVLTDAGSELLRFLQRHPPTMTRT